MQKVFSSLFVFIVLFPLVSGPGCTGKKAYKFRDVTFIQFYDPS